MGDCLYCRLLPAQQLFVMSPQNVHCACALLTRLKQIPFLNGIRPSFQHFFPTRNDFLMMEILHPSTFFCVSKLRRPRLAGGGINTEHRPTVDGVLFGSGESD